ncbi:GNAT family N-acetyltransferase [Azohydromonas caseinilytica]|uniref:N-acetyltransferase n=1 Tax=Azohydromonas caseinilytica TaxID=2728836 RepID=A0A848F0A9_9BURK|nr:GNAT family N-acetyltransferase [Azohydromonas caseinilytica]NML13497.1 N-acetyltransferase [Azohydromonas caseinilytica]
MSASTATPNRRSASPAPRAAWVPIRSLAVRHRPLILAHLLTLSESDRYLRFGYAASDAQVQRYVGSIDFGRDEVVGIFDETLALVAVAHLARIDGSAGAAPMAEFGVSVLPRARGRGWGSRLFERAVLHARNWGAQTMIIHALSENTAMLRIARKAGATIERDGGEAQALLRLPPEDAASRMDTLMAQQAGEFDYQLKLQALRLRQWWQMMLPRAAGAHAAG